MTLMSIESQDKTALSVDDLIAMAHSGCRDSFGILTDRFRDRMIVALYRRVGNRHDAEDIVQDAIAKAYRNFDRFDPRQRFSTWLYTIAFRLATDHQRRSRRWFQWLRDWNSHESNETGTVNLNSNGASTDSEIWKLASQALSELQYSALWLRYGEELTVEEIASVLQKREGTVRVLLSRARDTLARHLVNGMDSDQVESRTRSSKS